MAQQEECRQKSAAQTGIEWNLRNNLINWAPKANWEFCSVSSTSPAPSASVELENDKGLFTPAHRPSNYQQIHTRTALIHGPSDWLTSNTSSHVKCNIFDCNFLFSLGNHHCWMNEFTMMNLPINQSCQRWSELWPIMASKCRLAEQRLTAGHRVEGVTWV